MKQFQLIRGEAIEVLRTMPDNSVDSIVCDPPYGLKFMSKHWDYDLPSVDTWRECLRVLKPGGHLLAFAGTRTQHRMAVRIEDAGFEIRDMIAWMYGSGFPKSMDVSKAIDKAAGVTRDVVGRRQHPTLKSQDKLHESAGAAHGGNDWSREWDLTAPATPASAEWQGWGTALKPAMEPITVARKPLEYNTVAANVLAHGTGAINIDASRVPLTGAADAAEFANNHAVTERLPDSYDGEPLGMHDGGWKQRVGPAVVPTGRWPANVIHDGSDEVISAFPVAPGQIAKAATGIDRRKDSNVYGAMSRGSESFEPRDCSGSAARFFYAAKASKKDRDEGLSDLEDRVLARSCQAQAEAKRGNTVEVEAGAFNKARVRKNNHPTVKPTELMRYLVRLVTPPGGIPLDPFVGSGSTGKAAILEGFNFIGIDRDADENGNPLGYLDIARARLLHAGGIEVSHFTPVSLERSFSSLNVALVELLHALVAFSTHLNSTSEPLITNEHGNL